MSVTIRRASLVDAVPLLTMLRDQHREARVAHSPISESKALGNIRRAIERGAAFIAEIDGQVIGSIGCMTATDWWSEQESLADLWFYVRPAYRQSRAALLLFRAYSETAETMGLPRKTAVVDGNDIDRKDSFYQRFGLIPAGRTYMEGRP